MSERPEPSRVLVRYGEVALKGANRASFERTLARNLRAAAREVSPARTERRGGRILVLPTGRAEAVARRLTRVFGVKSVSPVWSATADAEGLEELAAAVFAPAAEELPRPGTFRVRTRRADKTFPVRSEDLDRRIGARLGAEHPDLTVRLDRPDLELGIEVRRDGAYVFVQRWPGPGGLPVGSLGRALCLLSGGIDSPVAAWLAMKRGLEVGFLTFHSARWVGQGALKKVQDLVRVLAPWQPTSRLVVAPFDGIQEAVRDGAPERYRTVLQRRSMLRVAQALARRHEAGAVVCGDSLGQVASQTLENIACVDQAAEIPVLRPLIAHDKEETIALARRLGTLDVSLIDEPDCCTVFQPVHPALRARVFDCERLERDLDLASLEQRCLAEVESWRPDRESSPRP